MFTQPFNPDFVKQRNEWLIYWCILCAVIGTFNAIERILIGVCGENLTFNVRGQLIRGIMYKQLSWFDQESRAPGVLTGVLAEDISMLNGLTTETLIVVLESLLGVIFGLVLACFFCWQEALLTLLFSPLLIIGAVALSRLSWGNKGGGKYEGTVKQADAYEKANALLSDIVLNYRTVQSFGQKNTDAIFKKFEILLEEPLNRRVKNSHIAGVIFGYS